MELCRLPSLVDVFLLADESTDGPIVSAIQDLSPLGIWQPANPLADAEAIAQSLRESDHPIVTWSGWSDEGSPLETWGPPGRERFRAFLEALRGLASERENAPSIMIRPRWDHVLSDAPSCLSWLREWGGEVVGGNRSNLRLLLDPAGLLSHTMLDSAEEHLDRFRLAFTDTTGVGGVVASNVFRDDQGRHRPAPLHDGLIDPRLIVAALPPGVPVVLIGAELDTQLNCLRTESARSN